MVFIKQRADEVSAFLPSKATVCIVNWSKGTFLDAWDSDYFISKIIAKLKGKLLLSILGRGTCTEN